MPHNVYIDDDGHRIEIGEAITLLDKLALGRRIKPTDGITPERTDKLVSRFRFNSYIRRELESHPLKPVVFETAMSLPRTHPYVLRAYNPQNLSTLAPPRHFVAGQLDELGATLSAYGKAFPNPPS